MKIKIYCFYAFTMVLCLSACKEKFDETDYVGKVIYDPEIADLVEHKLLIGECYSTTSYENAPIQDIYGNSKLYCKPNGVGQLFQDSTVFTWEDWREYFAYAYFDTLNQKLNIRIQTFHSSNPHWYFLFEQDVKTANCSSEMILMKNDEKSTFKTLKNMLVLDKQSYQIGDTIKGYAFYQAIETKFRERIWKEKFYFQCIVGKSSKPNDNYYNLIPCDKPQKWRSHFKAQEFPN